MARISANELLSRLEKGKPIPAILLLGEEPYLRDRCRALLMERYVPDAARPWAVSRYSADRRETQAALEQAQTMAMLSPVQVVVLEENHLHRRKHRHGLRLFERRLRLSAVRRISRHGPRPRRIWHISLHQQRPAAISQIRLFSQQQNGGDGFPLLQPRQQLIGRNPRHLAFPPLPNRNKQPRELQYFKLARSLPFLPCFGAVPYGESMQSAGLFASFLIVLRHHRHQPRRKILRQPIKGRILLIEEAFYIGRNLVLVAKQKVVRVIERPSCIALFQRDLALHRHQHRRGPPRSGVKQQRDRLETEHFPTQHGVAVGGFRHHAIWRLRQKRVNCRRCQSLLDPVTGGLILERRHGNHVNTFREPITSPRNVIAAAGKGCACRHKRNSDSRNPHNSFSASFTAFHAGNRRLSAAPQNHHVPWTVASACGTPSWIVFSPAAPTLLGVQSSSLATENPPSRHALLTDSVSATPGSNSAQAENIMP